MGHFSVKILGQFLAEINKTRFSCSTIAFKITHQLLQIKEAKIRNSHYLAVNSKICDKPKTARWENAPARYAWTLLNRRDGLREYRLQFPDVCVGFSNTPARMTTSFQNHGTNRQCQQPNSKRTKPKWRKPCDKPLQPADGFRLQPIINRLRRNAQPPRNRG